MPVVPCRWCRAGDATPVVPRRPPTLPGAFFRPNLTGLGRYTEIIMTETWVANLEAKARIVHGQLNTALRLSEKHGDSADLTSETYLEIIREIYQREFALAELMMLQTC